MKKINNNKTVSTVKKSAPKGKGKDTVIDVIAITPVSAPVIAPAPLPVQSASAPTALVMGVPNLNSRRINPRARVIAWRIANNQRKDVWSGGAKYYVQGGEIQTDPQTLRERFEVAIEIPFTDLYSAKVELVARKATLTAPAKIA